MTPITHVEPIGTMMSATLHLPKQYVWEPKPDITAYELALLLPWALGVARSTCIHPPSDPGAMRHLREVE